MAETDRLTNAKQKLSGLFGGGSLILPGRFRRRSRKTCLRTHAVLTNWCFWMNSFNFFHAAIIAHLLSKKYIIDDTLRTRYAHVTHTLRHTLRLSLYRILMKTDTLHTLRPILIKVE